jgi:hypothetical protein
MTAVIEQIFGRIVSTPDLQQAVIGRMSFPKMNAQSTLAFLHVKH